MKKKVKIEDSHFVPILSDGAIAKSDLADGRTIPVLVLDCAKHKELLNLIYLHENTPPGDVTCTWGANKKFVFLLMSFFRPSIVEVGVKFDIEKQWGLADGIVQSQGVYLQPSESGNKVVQGLSNPKLLIEVSPKSKLPDWDKRLETAIYQKMKREGLPRKMATKAAKESIKRVREIWCLRIGDA